MGMIGYYRAISADDVERLQDEEISVEEIIEAGGEELDIDKSWQALHYTLCGDIDGGEPPLGYVVPMLDDAFLDYGDFGAFCIGPAEVKEAVEALNGMDREALRQRYSLEEMAREEVYPIVEGEDAEEFFDYLALNLEAIRSFYAKAALEDNGVLFYVG